MVFGGEKETGGGRESGSDVENLHEKTNKYNKLYKELLFQGIKFDL